MNEKLVFKRSALIFLIGFVTFSIVGFIMKSISYPLGFLLGYLFNLAIFIPKWFNLIGVLFGYMVIKITIYIVSYQMKEVKE